MARTPSIEHSYLGPRSVRPLEGFNAADYRSLEQIGVSITPGIVARMHEGIGMDALTPLQTTPSVGTPVQFLQNWLPGFVVIITTPRLIDDLVGISTSGNWEDEEIVQGVMELAGGAVPYSDYGNIPLSSWNTNYAERSVIRFEQGMRVGILEEARASRQKVNTAASKRDAATMGLEIQRNSVGFFGYNGGANLTYGFLNDPGLGAFTALPNGAKGSPNWSQKTFQEITQDLRVAFSQLRTQNNGVIDPKTVNTTLALPIYSVDFLSVTTDYGESVQDWLTKNYPKCRVVSAPELDAAHGGQNVFYIYAESVKDTSTDDGRVFMQVVPTKFKVLGVQQMAKAYEEDYTNATAGVWCKRPYGVVRFFGC